MKYFCVMISTLLCISLQIFSQTNTLEQNIQVRQKKMTPMFSALFERVEKDKASNRVAKAQFKKEYHSREFPIDKNGRVYVSVTIIGEKEQVISEITALGCEITGRGLNSVTVWIPIEKINDIAELDGVGFINAVGYAVSQSGSVTSAGDKQLFADSSRNMFYTDGKTINNVPIKVGIISDGMKYYNNSVSSGDLPSTIGWVDNATAYLGSEGTAMMEIIHDLAPGAQLYFGGISSWVNSSGDTIPSTPLDMANRISSLASVGCKVIVDDMGWLYNSSWFQDREIAQAIYSFQTNGGTYVSAAGNEAKNMYGGIPQVKTSGNKKWLKFNGEDTTLTFTVSNYNSVLVALQWADPWQQASADLDLYVYDEWGNLKGPFSHSGAGYGIPPEEWVTLFPDTTFFQKKYKIMVDWKNYLSGDKEIKVLVFPRGQINSSASFTLTGGTTTNHIYGHAAAEDVISVAAYSASDQNTIENFSSRGPSNMIYTGGTTTFQRNTPVITATDGVVTKVGKDGHFGSDSLFFGTSAAAPHAAAVAALYFSRYPDSSRANFVRAIKTTASGIDGGTGGTYNTKSGYGKIRSYDAIAASMKVLNSPQVTTQNATWDLSRITGSAYIAAEKKAIVNASMTAIIEGSVSFGNTNSKIQVYGTLILSSSANLDGNGIQLLGNGRVIGGNFTTIAVNQLDESNTPYGMVGRLVSGVFDSANVPYTFGTTSSSVTLRASQEFKTGTTQKYWQWNNVLSNVINHRSFSAAENNGSFTSYLKSATNATLQAQLLDGGNPGGSVDFKDPWLIDEQVNVGSQIVYRNQGMSAPFKSVAYSTNNIGTSTGTKGVFLNQDYNIPGNSYYSVSAPATQTINGTTGYFQNWSYTNATLQNSTAQQTGVVFNNAGATVTANYKGTHISNTSAAYANSSARKFVRTPDNVLHQVYESMGHCWYEVSWNNGTSWQLANGGKPLDAGAGKNPSIEWTRYWYWTEDGGPDNFNAIRSEESAAQRPPGTGYWAIVLKTRAPK